VAAARHTDTLSIDGALVASSATIETVKSIGRAGPFGAGNPEPVVALPSHLIVYADPVGDAHVRTRLRAGDGATIDSIAFRAHGQKLGGALLERRGQRVHAAGCLAVDQWQGRERVQLRLIDVASADDAAVR